ncbi:MAG: HlyC/CorC family transporter [Planctomycetes bacterium]|nr:HlyC/CorC family transporter [Planctomycetota bacterium]
MAGLLLASAIFSSSETALFSLHRRDLKRLEESRTPVARAIRWLVDNPRKTLIGILLGNLAVNVLFFASVTRIVEELGASGAVQTLYYALALFAVLLLSELTPKTIALRQPLLLARVTCIPLRLIVLTLAPVAFVVEGLLKLANALMRTPRPEAVVRHADLKALISRSVRRQELDAREAAQLESVLELRDVRVREMMTPRVDLFRSELHANRDALRERVRGERPRWVLIGEKGIDDLKGYVRAEDLHLHPERTLEESLQSVCYVPESVSVLDFLRECRRRGKPFAIALDEFGGTAGMLTVEEAVEEIVGELRDEEERFEPDWIPLGGNAYSVDAGIKLRDLERRMGIALDARRFDTFAGYLSDRLGHVPEVGDTVTHERFRVRVVQVEEGRLRRVEMVFEGPLPDPPEEDA